MHWTKVLLPALLLSSLSPGARADVNEGTLLAHDRKANVIILRDRTVWSLDDAKGPLPAELKAGDRIEIIYQSDEDGVSSIDSIRILPPKPPQAGAKDVTVGRVLAFDRKSRTLVLKDRTVWSLADLQAELPAGLAADDLVEIRYESDEDGISAIESIEILR